MLPALTPETQTSILALNRPADEAGAGVQRAGAEPFRAVLARLGGGRDEGGADPAPERDAGKQVAAEDAPDGPEVEVSDSDSALAEPPADHASGFEEFLALPDAAAAAAGPAPAPPAAPPAALGWPEAMMQGRFALTQGAGTGLTVEGSGATALTGPERASVTPPGPAPATAATLAAAAAPQPGEAAARGAAPGAGGGLFAGETSDVGTDTARDSAPPAATRAGVAFAASQAAPPGDGIPARAEPAALAVSGSGPAEAGRTAASDAPVPAAPEARARAEPVSGRPMAVTLQAAAPAASAPTPEIARRGAQGAPRGIEPGPGAPQAGDRAARLPDSVPLNAAGGLPPGTRAKGETAARFDPPREKAPGPQSGVTSALAESYSGKATAPVTATATAPRLGRGEGLTEAAPTDGSDPALRAEAVPRLDAVADARPAAASPAQTAHRIAAQIGTALQAAEPASGGGFELALEPAELGQVRLKLVSLDNASLLIVHAERPETLDLMRRHIGALEQDLRTLGHDNLTLRFSGGEQGRQGPGGEQGQSRAPAPGPEFRAPSEPANAPPPARLASRDHLDLRL